MGAPGEAGHGLLNPDMVLPLLLLLLLLHFSQVWSSISP
jgi:hypothetical protein